MAATGRSRTDVGPSDNYFPIAPADGADLAFETREIIIASGGAVALVRPDGTEVTLTLPAGRFALKVARVKSTGTTATGITGVV